MGSKVSTSMRNALVLLASASLAVAQQQGVGPASTIQLQPGQFSVFGQPLSNQSTFPAPRARWSPSSLTRQVSRSPSSSWVNHSSSSDSTLSSSSGQPLPNLSNSSSGLHLSSSLLQDHSG